MPVLKDRHVVISRARNGREIYDTVCEWLNTTNYFKWTDDSVSYNNELEELDRKRRMLLLRRKISECGCVVLFAEMSTWRLFLTFPIWRFMQMVVWRPLLYVFTRMLRIRWFPQTEIWK